MARIEDIDDNAYALALWKIIAHHGYENQKEKAIEELNELGQAIARDLQGRGSRDNIAEEMADAHIMINQLMLIYGNLDEVRWWINQKLARTLERIEEERAGMKAK